MTEREELASIFERITPEVATSKTALREAAEIAADAIVAAAPAIREQARQATTNRAGRQDVLVRLAKEVGLQARDSHLKAVGAWVDEPSYG